jgi:chitin disaccharide deacetylase
MDNSKYLIVNADDYGRTPGVSKGIREAHLRGVITSTTAMMNMPGVETELDLAAKDTPRLGLGVHLVLTSGAPLLGSDAVSSITAGRDRFPTLDEFIENLGGVNVEQAAAEWDAQIRKFVKVTGRNPDHLDSHHHSSNFTEALFEKMLTLADLYHCPVRTLVESEPVSYNGLPEAMREGAKEYFPRLIRKFRAAVPDRFISTFYDETATSQQLLDILEHLEPGTSELMCHPGYADGILIEGSVYNRQRERELAILTSEQIREAVQMRGIELTNFRGLPQKPKN